MQFLATQSQSLSAPSFLRSYVHSLQRAKSRRMLPRRRCRPKWQPPSPLLGTGWVGAWAMCLPFPFWLEHGNASDFSLSFRRTLQFRWDDHFTLSGQRRGRRRSKTWWRPRCEDGALRPPARVNAIATPRIKRKREQQLGWGPSRIGTRCILGV